MQLKNNISCGLGCSLEWFDFALYGFFGPVFSKVFFPNAPISKWESLMIVYAIFAIGFAARPFGAIVFGYLGDKYGRTIPLKITPLFISIFTASIALLPTYQSAGFISIFMLLGLRIIQGVFLGGEFSNSIVYLCESSQKFRYFWGSIASFSGGFGIFIASATASIFYRLLDPNFLYTEGWRIAFLISIPIGIFTFFMRLRMSESPEFLPAYKESPLKITLKKQKSKLVLCLGLIYLHATSFYFVYMFLPVFLIKVRKVTEASAFFNNSWFLIFHLLLIPFLGKIVNKIGGEKSNLVACCLFFLLSPLCFYLISNGSHTAIFFGILALSGMTALNAAIIPGLLSEVIPSNVRCTILGVAFNLGFGIIGGIVPILCLFLVHLGGRELLPTIYLEVASLITLLSTLYAASIARKCYETR